MSKANTALKMTLVAMTAFVVTISIQLYQTTKVCDEKREYAIQSWSKANSDSEKVLSIYRDCTQGHFVGGAQKSGPMSFAGCATYAGSQSLADVIEESTNSIESPIPLRWL